MQLSLKMKGLSFAYDATDKVMNDIRLQTYLLYNITRGSHRIGSLTIISYAH